MENALSWITINWQWIALGVMIADKIVAATPTKRDDLILTTIKDILRVLPGVKKPKQ